MAEGDFHKETYLLLKAPLRQRSDRKNRARKRRVVGRIYRMKYSWKGHKDRNRHKNRITRIGQARLLCVIDMNPKIPTTWKWAHEGTTTTTILLLLPLITIIIIIIIIIPIQVFTTNIKWMINGLPYQKVKYIVYCKLHSVWFQIEDS